MAQNVENATRRAGRARLFGHPSAQAAFPSRVTASGDRVLFAARGTFEASTATITYPVLPGQALCLAAADPVVVTTRRGVALRCLYTQRHVRLLRGDIRVIDVDALSSALLDHAVGASPLDVGDEVAAAMMTLLADRLAAARAATLQLSRPVDDRARALESLLRVDVTMSLSDAIREVGASRRTLERLIRSETGLTLAAWWRRARMIEAIALIVSGMSVTQAAVAVGYSTPSAFVAAFRRDVGWSPRRYALRDVA